MKDVILTKDSGYLQIDNTGALPAIGPTSHNVGNWVLSTSGVFYQALEIDIAGLTAQELTFYPLSGDVQRGPVSLGITGGFINEWMFVTAAPIDPESIVPAYMNFGLLATGFIAPVTEFQNVLWGRAWTWALNTSIPQNFAVQVNTTSLGSGEATNGDRLYLYRFASLSGQTPLSGFAELPDVRVILSGQVREEAEFQQLMRMRRTYQLQQTYDED